MSGQRGGRGDGERFMLRLYVAGATAGSVHAIESIRRICDEQLEGRYELKVIDIYQQPEQAKQEDIVAVPTLVKQLPEPLRVLVGDLSELERVLVALDIEPVGKR
jgi:circadian clock protein KaiB